MLWSCPICGIGPYEVTVFPVIHPCVPRPQSFEKPANCCDPPGAIAKLCNFTGAMARHVIDRGRLLEPLQIAARATVCEGTYDRPPCPHYAAGKCTACGCTVDDRVSHFNKAALPTEDCPKGFWPKQ